MSKTITKRTILTAVNAALGLDKQVSTLEAKRLTASEGLAKVCRDAWKTTKGKSALADALFDLADDVEAKAGNPFHKLRQTLNTRCRISVKTVYDDDGETIIDFTLGAMKAKAKGKGKGKEIDPAKAYDSLVTWLTKRAESNPEFIKALLSYNANGIRKAVLDGARDAKVKL